MVSILCFLFFNFHPHFAAYSCLELLSITMSGNWPGWVLAVVN